MAIYKITTPRENYQVSAENKAKARKKVFKAENIEIKKLEEKPEDTKGRWIYLEQDDPRWADVTLGNTPYTIGDYGCLITCLSMLSYWYGKYFTPAEIAQKADFTGQGWYIWRSGDDFLPFEFVWRYYTRDIKKIKQILYSQDNACVVRVRYGNAYHWIAVIGFDNKSNSLIGADPIDGAPTYIEKEYSLIDGFAEVKRKK